jgi:hypothetical protein
MTTLTAPDMRTSPFVDETRNLANQCFERHYAMRHKDLNSETPHADSEAWSLIRTGFSAAIRNAERSGDVLLAEHFGALLNGARHEGAYLWLHGLAIDGGARHGEMQPIGEVVERVVARVGAPG